MHVIIINFNTSVGCSQVSTKCDFLSRNKKNIFEYALLSIGLVKHNIKTMELLMDEYRGEAGGPDRHTELSHMIIGILKLISLVGTTVEGVRMGLCDVRPPPPS